MKIGILTFHCAHNYGAVLQCYALQEILKAWGYDVEIIDYRPDFIEKPYKIWDYHRFISHSIHQIPLNIIKELCILLKRPFRYYKFNRFITTRLNLSKEKWISSKYDIYILGSDQIWNTKITKGINKYYWGKFDFTKENKRYITYAASMEVQKLDERFVNFYKESMNNLDYISVREEVLAQLLQPLTQHTIQTVLDPTLLAPTKIWDTLTKNITIQKKKYILVYQVRSHKRTIEIAQNLAQQINAQVIILRAWIGCKFTPKEYHCASPEYYLALIKNAEYIITTSFHGTAFSIIFKKNFYYIKLNDGEDSRSESLLNTLNLNDRIIKIDEVLTSPQNIDYKKSSLLLEKLKNKSELYLKNALSI